VLPRKFVYVTDWRWWLFTGGSHRHSFVSALYQINKTCRLLQRHWCYDTRCYFNVRSKADISRLNLPHVVSLLLGWSRQFVIKIYLSTPCIVFTSIDLQPNDLNKLVYFQHEGVYVHRAHIVLQFGCGRPNRGIRAPKYYPKWPSSVFLVYCGQTTVVLPVCCCLWMCTLAVSISFALDELSVS